MPNSRSSTTSLRPIPCSPPIRFSSRTKGSSSIATPLTLHGTPASKPSVNTSASSGAFCGDRVNT